MVATLSAYPVVTLQLVFFADINSINKKVYLWIINDVIDMIYLFIQKISWKRVLIFLITLMILRSLNNDIVIRFLKNHAISKKCSRIQLATSNFWISLLLTRNGFCCKCQQSEIKDTYSLHEKYLSFKYVLGTLVLVTLAWNGIFRLKWILKPEVSLISEFIHPNIFCEVKW